jgi:hypothetical protein
MRMIFGAIGGMKFGRGNRSTRRKPTPAPICPPQNPTWQTRSRTPDRSGGKPATNRLSYGATSCQEYIAKYMSERKTFRTKLVKGNKSRVFMSNGLKFPHKKVRNILQCRKPKSSIPAILFSVRDVADRSAHTRMCLVRFNGALPSVEVLNQRGLLWQSVIAAYLGLEFPLL